MTTIHANGQNYSVLFKADPALRLARNGFETVSQVQCAIVDGSNRIVAAGHAFKAPNDEEDDFIGMEVALGRALHRLTPDKELRKKFWDVFNRARFAETVYVEPEVFTVQGKDYEVIDRSNPYRIAQLKGILDRCEILDCTRCPDLRVELAQLEAAAAA